MSAYTYTQRAAAHYGSNVVTVPDRVADDQRGFANADKSFPALRADGSKVRVRLDAEAYGLFTTGTGDMIVRSA